MAHENFGRHSSLLTLPPIRMAHSASRHPEGLTSLRSQFLSASQYLAAFFSTRKRLFGRVASLRIHQHLFIRTAKSIRGFSGDILTNSACAPFQPSPCDPLRVPNLVTTKKVLLLDPEGNPVREARLEFHEYTKGRGKFVASLATDRGGVADVSSLETGGLLRMSITSER